MSETVAALCGHGTGQPVGFCAWRNIPRGEWCQACLDDDAAMRERMRQDAAAEESERARLFNERAAQERAARTEVLASELSGLSRDVLTHCRSLESGRNHLQEQRDELLKACRAAAEWSAGFPLGGDMDALAAADVYSLTTAAIARVESS